MSKKIKRDDFIATIGYDGETAIASKTEVTALRGKTFEQILAAGNYRYAAACALYDESETEKQQLIDAYNNATGAHYSIDKIEKLFGISIQGAKKVLYL